MFLRPSLNKGSIFWHLPQNVHKLCNGPVPQERKRGGGEGFGTSADKNEIWGTGKWMRLTTHSVHISQHAETLYFLWESALYTNGCYGHI